MKSNKEAAPARQRIMRAASELFYKQGYRATGISDIIKLADVAKATFYAHFNSKEALCVEYLNEQNEAEKQQILAAIAEADTVYERFLAPARLMEPFSAVGDQRGCRFLNMAAEIPQADNVLRKPGVDHYLALREVLRDLTQELKESCSDSYGHLHVDATADSYLLLLTGGLITAELFDDLWPVRHIVFSVQQLVRPSQSSATDIRNLEAV